MTALKYGALFLGERIGITLVICDAPISYFHENNSDGCRDDENRPRNNCSLANKRLRLIGNYVWG